MQLKHANAALLAIFALGGCSSPYIVGDPSTGIPVADILKSIKCEAVTFLEVNRRQREAFGIRFRAGDERAYQFPYLDIGDALYAGIFVDLKDVDTFSLTVGGTRVVPLSPEKAINWTFGPSANQVNTFELVQNFAMQQNASLSDPQDLPLNLRRTHGPLNEQFRCFDRLRDSKSEFIDYVSLSDGTRNDLARFERIYVNGSITLSQWLYNVASTMSKNFLSSVENREVLAPGQLSYSFVFNYTLGLNGKYSLVASLWRPLDIGGSVSKEHTSSFQMIFNTNYAIAAAGARNGSVEKDSIQNPLAILLQDRTAPPRRHGENFLRGDSRRASRQLDIPPSTQDRARQRSFDEKNNPSLIFRAPLALPSTIPPP
ncbi:hypothetical protein GGQ91_002499 [Methylobacterium fujisawaense]|uniref:Uncharacterized protein n=1 Tax=Methylobacterium fujisawaense TaxID=107400 RepID=A0ABR6DAK7_9HYPH|nr:hypothetical protein [Methylobacterium fujisawaense]MBA9063111.1 hypothetical protein [Methylobacterium fujisawaense]